MDSFLVLTPIRQICAPGRTGAPKGPCRKRAYFHRGYPSSFGVSYNLSGVVTRVRSDRFRFRVACQNAIFQNFEAARSVDVEGRLWEAHLKINNRFRKLLARVSVHDGIPR